MKVFDTSGYIAKLYAGTFNREDFLCDAKACGAEELHVDTRFFPERAMYWTRMLRNAASQQGMELSTLLLESELIAGVDTVEAQRANLSEWIRIAALSKIRNLKIRVNGRVGMNDAWSMLAQALHPLVAIARQYGTTLILTDGSARLGDNQLIRAAKALGYANCRISPAQTLSGTALHWVE